MQSRKSPEQSVARREFLKWTGASLAALVASATIKTRSAAALTIQQSNIIVAAAWSKLGTPYKLPPEGFPQNTDCSLLTQWCYSQAGLFIRRTAAQQYAGCLMSTNMAGSLVFFDTVNPRPITVTHVGINLGNGWMIDANSAAGQVVHEPWASSAYWRARFIDSATM